eukprot:PhM_4_TR12368/c0_g1_i1/m.64830
MSDVEENNSNGYHEQQQHEEQHQQYEEHQEQDEEEHGEAGALMEASPARTAYASALEDLHNIALAGTPSAAAVSIESLQHLRETEMQMFTDVPEQYTIVPRKSATVAAVPSRVGSTHREGYEGTPKKRQDPLHHIGQSLCDPNRPLPTAWKKGDKPAANFEVQSTLSTLFSANGGQNNGEPSNKILEKGSRRQEIEERRQSRMSKFVPPAKAGATKAALQPLPPKPTKKVSTMFVPACATKMTEETENRRREIERQREEEGRRKVGAVPFR